MRAINVADGNVRLVEVPNPEAGSHDLLVRVEAAGLNASDMHRRKELRRHGEGSEEVVWIRAHEDADGSHAGDTDSESELRDRGEGSSDVVLIRGHEVAGTVVGVGRDTKRFSVGDPVMGLSHAVAGLAELALLPEPMAMPIPKALSMIEAGGFPEVFCVADDALFTICGLTAGDRVLVTGAAGGVGMAAVQLAIATGASAVASARNEKNWPMLQELGATTCSPSDAYELGPYDVILELVDHGSLENHVKALKSGGHICLTGAEGSYQRVGDGVFVERPSSRTELNIQVLSNVRGHIHAAGMSPRSIENKAIVARQLERRVFPLLERGAVRVLIDSTFAFDDAKAAFERFREGGKLGKVVLTSS